MAAKNLRDIRAFPELVRYLEDELDWPLQEYGFDELTFEFTPAELGLKEEDAARIKVIRQLRPLVSGQPWGIFFVEFENKKLPVVVLRRILSHLVIKKRASANKASAPAWHAEDLLFVTAFGEDGTDAREIAFAHFHQNPGDMPTLHVLGWDGGDTPLKLANVDHVLHERLHWPEDEGDAKAWREMWRKPFKHRIGHIIQTADLLAEELAKLARGIRDKAKILLAAESEHGPITKLFKAFQTALIHDLTPESFADTYAQTITYGLLTAAISRTEMSEGRHGTALVADNVVDMVPVTNPFLKEMLQTFLKVGGRKGGIDFDELGIQDVVELLRGDETDLPAILRDFGNRTRGEDPVIHFYEHFLSAYNKQLKIQRGVFYTPQPVVSYIVRSVHELLQTEFGLEDGLASTITWGEMLKKHPDLKLPPLTDEPNEARTISPDEPFVQILDPATGTATFLVEVIDVIHRTLAAKWKQQRLTEVQQLAAWNDYVPKHLLPRLHAYELMMAPYAIAHMKIGLKLAETRYHFGTEERARIYLTNALEPWQRQLNLPDFEALAHEAAAVNEIKRHKRFTVVIGNPPYSQMSQNLGEQERALVAPYRFVDGARIQERGAITFERNLQDDYIKFIRLSEIYVVAAGVGICGIITNHAFLSNITLRGMRAHLLSSFNSISITDLHGNSKIHEEHPDGNTDENVFDIQQGVAVSLMTRNEKTSARTITFAELWGTRESKYHRLIASSKDFQCHVLLPQSPNYLFVARDNELAHEYEAWPMLNGIMPLFGSAITTARDKVVVDFEGEEIVQRVNLFQDFSMSDAKVLSSLEIGESAIWSVAEARRKLKGVSAKEYLTNVSYRPFDTRRLFYHDALISSPRHPTMRHMKSENSIALAVCRQQCVPGFQHVFVSTTIFDEGLVSNRSREKTVAFPLYLTKDDERQLIKHDAQTPNLNPKFISQLQRQLGLKSLSSGQGSLTPHGTLGADDMLHYIYAVLHSVSYRRRYEEFLKTDFPRLPLTSILELFSALARLGGELVALHLLESPKVNNFITRFEGKGDNSIPKKPIYKDGAVWINASQRFEGVPEAVWNFHIGGYQVCEKWLKDRKGRTLSADDIAHYQRVVVALNETIRLMTEIDRVIDNHGGWPGAFQASAAEVAK